MILVIFKYEFKTNINSYSLNITLTYDFILFVMIKYAFTSNIKRSQIKYTVKHVYILTTQKPDHVHIYFHITLNEVQTIH